VEFLVGARREDISVLLDTRELPGAIGAEPLVADVIDGPLGAWAVGGLEGRGVRRAERGDEDGEPGYRADMLQSPRRGGNPLAVGGEPTARWRGSRDADRPRPTGFLPLRP
jgi:hypothetical protein